MKKISLIVFVSSCLLFNSCSNQSQKSSINKSDSLSEKINVNAASQDKLKDGIDLKTSGMSKAKFGDYNYSFKEENQRTVAVFTEKFLPRDDKVVVSAIRDVIKQTYSEDATGIPLLKEHNRVNKIHLDSKKNDFYIDLVKEDTGEVHSLIIKRESK